jgi:hypothetical protein
MKTIIICLLTVLLEAGASCTITVQVAGGSVLKIITSGFEEDRSMCTLNSHSIYRFESVAKVKIVEECQAIVKERTGTLKYFQALDLCVSNSKFTVNP